MSKRLLIFLFFMFLLLNAVDLLSTLHLLPHPALAETNPVNTRFNTSGLTILDYTMKLAGLPLILAWCTDTFTNTLKKPQYPTILLTILNMFYLLLAINNLNLLLAT